MTNRCPAGLRRVRRRCGTTVAGWAFDYATGPRTADGWFGGPVFPWTCPACGQTVSDRGPCRGPRDDESGHTDGCRGRMGGGAGDGATWSVVSQPGTEYRATGTEYRAMSDRMYAAQLPATLA